MRPRWRTGNADDRIDQSQRWPLSIEVGVSRRQLPVEEPITTPALRRTVSLSPCLAEELTKHLDTFRGERNLVFT